MGKEPTNIPGHSRQYHDDPSNRSAFKKVHRVPQEAGPQDEVFLWMYQAANVPEEGWAGGKPHLVGWVDTGDEGNDLRTAEQGKIYFLGYTGFRFPICHYPNCSVKASELHIIWDVIARLQDWGFSVAYILQDGGEENRHFIKSHFNGNPLDSKYMAVNLINQTKFVAINGIMKSGDINGLHTKKMKLNEKYILWKHWISAVHWDREVHSRPIHHKVSDAHLYPNSAEKMRNHLAEEMLDSNTLFLMKSYQASLPDGSYLNNHRPVKNVHDERLQYLYHILQWFTNWRISANNDESIAKGERSKSLLSSQCCDDVESMLVTFSEICKRHLEEFPYGGVVPSRFNTDILENHFCQERGLHNGNATHPSYSTYCSTVNSVILGESLKSRGRKSNSGIAAAKPFTFYVNEPLTKRRKKAGLSEFKFAVFIHHAL
ncbi:hypothetical protein ACJMK2_041457 [Sinanodonta woodiana]|uniref:Uncharacterized protein n=1 Tax=Sinanodonta woodiana TaxID=1069815 RepID=A0ABD3W4C6_SINWO